MTTNKQTTAPANGVQASNGSAHDGCVRTSLLGDMPENPLSDREMEVARLLVTGATNGEIARVLVISPHTVKVHLRNVFDKLQVSSRTEASMLLVKRGWVVMPGVEVGGAECGQPLKRKSPAIPEPEPLLDLEAKSATLATGRGRLGPGFVALTTLLLPAWITTPKSTVGLLSDSGQTVLGKPVLNNLPYRWEVQAPLSQPRSRMAAVELAGQIYVMGGEGGDGTPLDLVEIYDLALGQWRKGASLTSPRANLALTISGDDLIIAGGSRLNNEGTDDEGTDNGADSATEMIIYDDMALYDRGKDLWTTGGKLPMPLAGMALTAHDEMLYLMGGWNGRAMQDGVWRLPLSQFESAKATDWEMVSHLPKAVAWFGAVMVNDLIYVVGGYDGVHELADFATYNVTSGEWRTLASLTTPRGGEFGL